MTSAQFIVFIALLILPSAYQRVKFAWKRSMFMKTALRDKSGLAIHHGHWGLLCVFAGSIALAFGWHDWATIILIGYGWGLILDEIVPMFKMPSVGRETELDVYARALPATAALVASVAVLSLLVFLASSIRF